MIGLPSYQSWSGWVPPTPRTVGALGTPKSKSGKFLIYPPFQWARASIARPMLYHLLGRGCCKKATVPHLPIRPLQFTGGSPKRVKLENFLYILRSSGPRPADARQYYTNSGALGCAHKISTDIRPMLPPFFTGGQNVRNFGPNFDPSRLQTAIFFNCGVLSENKNKLVKNRS